jgi:hypothetical protein
VLLHTKTLRLGRDDFDLHDAVVTLDIMHFLDHRFG